MKEKLYKYLDYFCVGFEKMFEMIGEALDFETFYCGDRTIEQILDHPADKRLIDETIEYLKYSWPIREKEITLSCGNNLIISI